MKNATLQQQEEHNLINSCLWEFQDIAALCPFPPYSPFHPQTHKQDSSVASEPKAGPHLQDAARILEPSMSPVRMVLLLSEGFPPTKSLRMGKFHTEGTKDPCRPLLCQSQLENRPKTTRLRPENKPQLVTAYMQNGSATSYNSPATSSTHSCTPYTTCCS